MARSTGSSCVPTNDGVEICDGLDNDCDGQLDSQDEQLDDAIEINGDCTEQRATATAVLQWLCTAGVCSIDQCAPGLYDIDADTENGCEYACTVATPSAEP